jgi:hypothetical protein
MFRTTLRTRQSLLALLLSALLMSLLAPAALADGPTITIKPVVAPRRSPPPIPHSSVLAPGVTLGFTQSDGLRPQSVAANSAAKAQGATGKPGVLKTQTGVGYGIALYAPGNVCNDFNLNTDWRGETWTNYFAGWGAFAADDGYFQAKNVTFDREQVVGPGNKFGKDEASLKIASNQPYDAGVMSPAISVEPGDTVKVRVAYLVYNHDLKDRAWDYASMGIIPELGKHATYVLGYQRGEWAILEQEVQATGDQVVVMLQGHSPDALNSNIYFDNVEIYINGVAVKSCKG